MDWQIVDPDLGLNYNAEFSTGDLHFETKWKNIWIAYIAAIQIVMLNDTVLLIKNLVQF